MTLNWTPLNRMCYTLFKLTKSFGQEREEITLWLKTIRFSVQNNLIEIVEKETIFDSIRIKSKGDKLRSNKDEN